MTDSSAVAHRGNIITVFLEPRVVRGGEVQLRDRGKADLPETRQLSAKAFDAPTPLHSKLGVAWIDYRLGDIHDDGVQPSGRHAVCRLAPQRLIKL